MNLLYQGFSTFCYLRTPKTKLCSSAYPQIRVVPPLRTPKSQLYSSEYLQIRILPPLLIKISYFRVVFKLSRTPCELLAYPQGYAYPRLRTAVLYDWTLQMWTGIFTNFLYKTYNLTNWTKWRSNFTWSKHDIETFLARFSQDQNVFLN